MRRRDFIKVIGGSAAAWPLAARAQQGDRLRRIGFQSNLAEGDQAAPPYVAAFEQTLAQLGWVKGRNVQIDYRWTAGDPTTNQRTAAELLALNPDVILTVGGGQVRVLEELTSTTPIVFVQTADPAGVGLVDSLARPGHNVTGFSVFEFGIGGKWLGLLKEIAPRVTRVAVLQDTRISSGPAILASAQAVASPLGTDVLGISFRDAAGIERGIEAFAEVKRGPDRGAPLFGDCQPRLDYRTCGSA